MATGTKILILNSDGQTWTTQFDPSAKIQSVVQSAAKHFYPADQPSAFKVIYPEGFRALNDLHAVQDEKLKDNDLLLLVRRRKFVMNDTLKESELKSPTKEQILAATKSYSGTINLPPPEPAAEAGASGGRSAKRRDSETEFIEVDLRRMIISLVSLMATMNRGKPEIDTILNEMKAKVKKRFEKVTKDQNESASPAPLPEIVGTPAGIISALIEAKKREFHPNPKAYEALQELGYNEAEILDALRTNKNNKDAAMEWLLAGDRRIPEDTNEGLDTSSHLYKTLTENPTIRLGLHNPKTMLALLEMVESAGNATVWLADPDTSGVLAAMFKIYHSEHHALPDNVSTPTMLAR